MNSRVKNLLFWVVVGLFMILLFNLFSVPTHAPEEDVIFSDFMAKIEKGDVEKAIIKGNHISSVLKDKTRIRTFSPDYPDLVKVLREKDVQIEVKPPEESPWYITFLVTWGPFILFLGLWFFLMRQMQVGGNKALSFGKSRARMLTEDRKKVTFSDVAGIEEAKEEVLEIIEFLRDPRKFQKLGGRIPKGVLIVGPPGTGKTWTGARLILDLIADGKKNPDKLNYGTSGIGGTGHLLMIEVEQTTGARFTHVPFKGGPEWMQALLGDHIQFVPDGAQWAPFVESGQVRVLAMATPARFPKYPDVPNLTERGINAVAVSPYGLVGPKDLPPAIVETLHGAYKEAMADPGHQPLLDKFIQVPWYRSPAEYRAFAEKYYVDVKPMLVKSGLAKA